MSTDSSPIKERQIGDYLIQEVLGDGGFAKVYLGMHIPTKERVAIKVIDKEELFSEEENKKRLLLEISILKKVRHKNIIKLYEIMETPQTIYLVMEYCNSGELFDFIVSKDKLNEKQACAFYQEVIDALSYLHSQNIVHRDIKPENILLNKINRNINCKLIDFGISRTFEKNQLIETPCGTASYAPPEMHNGEAYSPILSDAWSSGVLLFSMVCGYLPFSEEDEYENIRNILKGNYEIPDDGELSPELIDLIKHLLDINPETRYNLEKIKAHPWFNLVPQNPRPGIIIGYHRIPIDDKILKQCELFGYNKDEVIDSVKKNRYDKNSAVYYILLKKFENQGIESISDLFSDKYLEYINDKNNLLTEEEIIEFKNEMEKNEKENNKGKDLNKKFENINDKSSEEDIYSDRSIEEINNNELSSPNRDNGESEEKEEKEQNEENEESNEKKENKENKDLIFVSDDEDNEDNIINNYELEEINNKNEISGFDSDKDINTSILEIGNKNGINLDDDIGKEDKKYLKSDENLIGKEIEDENEKDNDRDKNICEIEKNNDINNKENEIDKKEMDKNIEVKKEEKEKEKEKINEKNKLVKIKSCRITRNKKDIQNNKFSLKLKPFNSFNLESNTYQILNQINFDEIEMDNNKNNNDALNTSFTIRLTDTIKENILKMKNPKKKDQMTTLKILEALNKLNTEKAKNIPKKRVKKVKFSQNENILSKGNKKEHTIIKNRNASVHLDKRKKMNTIEEEINTPTKKKMHQSLRKLNKEKKYIKYKNNLKAENFNTDNKKNNINVINLNGNKNSKKNLRISKKIEAKNKEIPKNNNKNNNKLSDKISKAKFQNNNNSKGKRNSNHIYLKTDMEIDKKVKRTKNSNTRYTINIKSRNDKNETPKKINDSNSILINSRKKNIRQNNNNKLNSTISNKKKENKNVDYHKNTIETYRTKNNNKDIKKIPNKNNINNNIINKYNSNNTNKKLNNKNNISCSYNTNDIINKKNNKQKVIELKKNKIKNYEENDLFKNRLTLIKNNNKNAKNRLNKSTEIRTKFGHSLRNKNDLDIGFEKIDKINTKEKDKAKIPNTERVKKIKIKKNEKIKIDKNNKYKGPLDTKNLIVSDSIEYIQEKIFNSLKINKIKYWNINPLKYACCAKNMDKFYIEICFVSELSEYNESIKKNKNCEDIDENIFNIKKEKKCLFYIKILLSKENNDIPNCKLIEKVINNI